MTQHPSRLRMAQAYVATGSPPPMGLAWFFLVATVLFLLGAALALFMLGEIVAMGGAL